MWLYNNNNKILGTYVYLKSSSFSHNMCSYIINNGNEFNQLSNYHKSWLENNIYSFSYKKPHLLHIVKEMRFIRYLEIIRHLKKQVCCQTIINCIDPNHAATNHFSGTMVIKRTILKVLTNEPTQVIFVGASTTTNIFLKRFWRVKTYWEAFF